MAMGRQRQSRIMVGQMGRSRSMSVSLSLSHSPSVGSRPRVLPTEFLLCMHLLLSHMRRPQHVVAILNTNAITVMVRVD